MSFNLKPYQKRASDFISKNVRDSISSKTKEKDYESNILKAVTGAGKTVILSDIINQINNEQRNDYCIFWLSSFPEINEQSKIKVEKYNPHLSSKLITLDSSNYLHGLQPQHIYFLNYAKITESSNMSKGGSDSNNTTFWNLPFDNLKIIFIIDEAHIGSSLSNNDIKKNKTILNKLIEIVKPKFVIGASATPDDFKQFIENIPVSIFHNVTTNYKSEIYTVPINEVCESGMIKSELTNVSFKVNPSSYQSFNSALFLDSLHEFVTISNYWENEIQTDKRPVFLLQVEDQFEDNNEDITIMLDCLFSHNKSHYIRPEFIFHTFPNTKFKGIDSKGVSYEIPSIKPNDIMTNTNARIIIFKENLSTGWDCPNAEILFSMKKQHKDSTIAQTLGRILRNPFINDPSVYEKHKARLSSVSFYTPLFNQEVINEIIDDFGIIVKTKQIGTNDSITYLVDEVKDYFSKNKILHHDYLFPKVNIVDKINTLKEQHENEPDTILSLEKVLQKLLESYGTMISSLSSEISQHLCVDIDKYTINLVSKEQSQLKFRKDAKEEQKFRAKLDWDNIKNYVKDSLGDAERLLDSIFAKQWRNPDEKSFYLFYENSLKTNELKSIISDLIKKNEYGVLPEKEGYIILLKYFLTKHTSFLKDLEQSIDKIIEPAKNNPIPFMPEDNEKFVLDFWNKWEFVGSNVKSTNDESKFNFLIIEPKIAYLYNNEEYIKQHAQAMKLNELEQHFVEHSIIPFGFDLWWRNPSTSKGLGIFYIDSHGVESLYRPDFLAIKNNDLYILEGKVKRDEWNSKYEGLNKWVEKQKENGFQYKIHHIWCFEEGSGKNKKYYTVQNAKIELIKKMKTNFSDLIKTNDSNKAMGFIKQIV